MVSVLTFTSTVRTNRRVGNVSQTLTFNQTIEGHVYSATVVQSLEFVQQITYVTTPVKVVQRLEFEQSVNFVKHLSLNGVINNQLVFTQLVEGRLQNELPGSIEQNLQFVQNVRYNLVRHAAISHTLQFQSSVSHYFENVYVSNVALPPPFAAYANQVSLALGDDQIVLRNPDFGDKQEHNQQRVLRKSRGGDLQVFRDDTWTKHDKLSYTFSALTENKAEQLAAFLKRTVGQKVTLVDYNGWTWEGFITNPDSEIVEVTANCGYTASFDFEGDKI